MSVMILCYLQQQHSEGVVVSSGVCLWVHGRISLRYYYY